MRLASGKATQSAAPTVLPNSSEEAEAEKEEEEEAAPLIGERVESSASMTENADWNSADSYTPTNATVLIP